jgi:CRP-like cAMP-binding protein
MGMETLERMLGEHPFFNGLDERYLAIIVGCASNARFDADKFIAREGEQADNFYLIRHGRVALEVFAPGRGEITIQTLGEGDILGWSWLIPPYRWRFDARAVEMTRAIALDGKCLRAKCEENHDLGYELLKRFVTIMASRLEATRLQILDLYGAHA